MEYHWPAIAFVRAYVYYLLDGIGMYGYHLPNYGNVLIQPVKA